MIYINKPYSKYRAKGTYKNGYYFRSKKELKRYEELLLLEKAKRIRNLQVQPVFPLAINGYPLGRYIADFIYHDKDGRQIVEDVKGLKKGAVYNLFKLKKKLVLALYNLEVKEI
jgi:hypothetical protein